jgi:hypothetical protein
MTVAVAVAVAVISVSMACHGVGQYEEDKLQVAKANMCGESLKISLEKGKGKKRLNGSGS